MPPASRRRRRTRGRRRTPFPTPNRGRPSPPSASPRRGHPSPSPRLTPPLPGLRSGNPGRRWDAGHGGRDAGERLFPRAQAQAPPVSLLGLIGNPVNFIRRTFSLEDQINPIDSIPEDQAPLPIKCNPFSAELFNIGSTTRTIPLLCSSSKSNYCEQVWKYCKSTAILNSPFQSPVQESAGLAGSSSMLTDFWPSENDFWAAFSSTPSDKSTCFNGHGVSFNTSKPSPSPKGMCIEKIGDGSYLSMVAHPDGSSKAFFSRQDGKIWLATVPEQGMGDSLQLDETSPFLDLTTEGYLNSDFGLLDVAVHPDFANNGRFFVSYICDRTQSPKCAGRCSCDCDVGCDPSKLGSDNGVRPCQYQLVVSEYSAIGSSSNFSVATYADPSEVRRVFSMGLPYAPNHGGQLLVGPTDGYLYFLTGNDGKKGDPYNFSQNKKSLLGKIIRLNIDDFPKLNGVASRSLWGNYTIPKDNPNADDSSLRPEIWALGIRNPGRCSFDSERPLHLYCADDGQEQYKVVDLITKGGNYGWGVFEDQHVRYPPWAAEGTKPTDGIIFPIMGYKVSSVSENTESASIVGGYVYRGSADPCLYGRYLFADMYTSAMWIGTETTDGSGKYTSASIPFSCSKKTPIHCSDESNSPLGPIFSFGEDNKKDVFILASQGVYRVVQPTLCDYTCLNTAMAKGATPSGSNGIAPVVTYVLASVISALFTALGLLACRCFCNWNSPAICCNEIDNVQVINHVTHSAPPPPPKPSDIEMGMRMAIEFARAADDYAR